MKLKTILREVQAGCLQKFCPCPLRNVHGFRVIQLSYHLLDTKHPGLGSMTEQDCDGGTVNELFYINIEPQIVHKPEMKTPKASKKSKHTIVWNYILLKFSILQFVVLYIQIVVSFTGLSGTAISYVLTELESGSFLSFLWINELQKMQRKNKTGKRIKMNIAINVSCVWRLFQTRYWFIIYGMFLITHVHYWNCSTRNRHSITCHGMPAFILNFSLKQRHPSIKSGDPNA